MKKNTSMRISSLVMEFSVLKSCNGFFTKVSVKGYTAASFKMISYKLLIHFFLIIHLSSCNINNEKPSYTDSSLPVEKRVDLLFAEMTLDEKIAQLCAQSLRFETAIEEGVTGNNQELMDFMRNGIGQVDNTFDRRSPKESAIVTNSLQKYLRDSTRLKIPALVGSECLHGHAGYNSTIFPSPVAMACSWNPELVNRVFDITAREARMRGSTEAHTPVLDMGRDPRWGRIEETYGEDTYLVSQMGYAAVTGLQGGNTGNPGQTHIISSAKHFAGYAQGAGGRNFAPTIASTRMFFDEILPPFEKVVKEGNALGIMASHADIDGIPAHGNKWLLTELLRDRWGFTGYVVSDYMDIERLTTFHRVTENPDQAASLALRSGMDLDLPAATTFRHLKQALEDDPGLEEYLDRSVKRILRLKFMLGLFENPFVDPDACEKFVGSPENVEIARKIAEESIVLLKNRSNILPLNLEQINSIAVIGPNAASLETGVYSVSNDQTVSILEGIKKTVQSGIEIKYAEGCKIAVFENEPRQPTLMRQLSLEEEEGSIIEAVALARQSDVVIACVGGNRFTSREAVYRVGDLGDRATLNLLGNQEELLRRLFSTGKPVIVVLMGGKPYAIPEIAEKADAILAGFYLGQENGIALGNVLSGKVNPGGKLAVSFPRCVGQLPVYYSQKASAFYKDYLEMPASPLFSFGFGLSYSTFEISDLQLENENIDPGTNLKFSIKLKNTGKYEGAEVVQVYFSDPVASVTRPEKLLVRFQKVYLMPGEEKKVLFEINPEVDLSFTGIDFTRVLEPGEFNLQVGNSSENILIEKKFYVL